MCVCVCMCVRVCVCVCVCGGGGGGVHLAPGCAACAHHLKHTTPCGQGGGEEVDIMEAWERQSGGGGLLCLSLFVHAPGGVALAVPAPVPHLVRVVLGIVPQPAGERGRKGLAEPARRGEHAAPPLPGLVRPQHRVHFIAVRRRVVHRPDPRRACEGGGEGGGKS